ncbi:MAG: 6-phosphofructokinase [Planctomycetes bacterium]|nr:6-phosphofructokinase [Planctomycetota bacterium]
MPEPKKLAMLTGGGDCPGLNAVIRAAVMTARNYGWEVYGVRNGFAGLLRVDVLRLSREKVKGILHTGGTILGSTNKVDPFAVKAGTQVDDQSDLVIENFRNEGFEALITIGGDGTQNIAYKFLKRGIPVVGVPKTIDNDVSATEVTFGFDTAVATATDALDKLHPTAESHQRVMVVEVMGRNAGWIALHSGIAGGADVILIPEIPFDIDKVCAKVRVRYEMGRNFAIIVVAEGALPTGGEFKGQLEDRRHEATESSLCNRIAQYIRRDTGHDVRAIVLGHLQRGGSPTTYDRLLGSRYGAAAVRLVRDGQFGKMVALRGGEIVAVDLHDAIERMKAVPVVSDIVQTARDLGIAFGD